MNVEKLEIHVEKLERQQLRFILREFAELQELLRKVIQVEQGKNQDIKKAITNILKKLRGFIVAGEERIEYRLAQNYAHFRKVILEAKGEFAPYEGGKIMSLLRKADVYNALLEKLGSRGGEIEQALKAARDAPDDKKKLTHAHQCLAEALEADRAFEVVMKELMAETNTIKLLKSRLKPWQQLSRLALLHDNNKGNNVLILYDEDRFHEEMGKATALYNKSTGHDGTTDEQEKERAWKEINEYLQTIQYTKGGSMHAEAEKLSYWEAKIADHSIIGYCELKLRPKPLFLGAYEIFRIAAKSGFGPFLFELVFSFAAQEHHPVIIDRGSVTPAARKVWQTFDVERRHIIKYPAALAAHPELVGYGKKEVWALFGSGPFGSTFTEEGLPEGTDREKDAVLRREFPLLFRSYLKDEGRTSTNKVVGGLASLDKAFYYDGQIAVLNKLMVKGEALDIFYRSRITTAGLAFFQQFNPS